jgi:hypothetical protein
MDGMMRGRGWRRGGRKRRRRLHESGARLHLADGLAARLECTWALLLTLPAPPSLNNIHCSLASRPLVAHSRASQPVQPAGAAPQRPALPCGGGRLCSWILAAPWFSLLPCSEPQTDKAARHGSHSHDSSWAPRLLVSWPATRRPQSQRAVPLGAGPAPRPTLNVASRYLCKQLVRITRYGAPGGDVAGVSSCTPLTPRPLPSPPPRAAAAGSPPDLETRCHDSMLNLSLGPYYPLLEPGPRRSSRREQHAF